MRIRLFLAAVLALFAPAAFSQAYIQLSSAKVMDSTGGLLTGKVVLTVVNSGGTPVTYTPQAGSPSSAPFVDAIVKGIVQPVNGLPFQILNVLTASPSGLGFHYQLESTDGTQVYLDVPFAVMSSTTGGYSLDSYTALAGTAISGLGFPRVRCSPTAIFNQSDGPNGAQPWICSQLIRGDNTNQWTQSPSAFPNCQNGFAIVSPASGPPYCILPEAAFTMPGNGLVNPDTNPLPGPMRSGPAAGSGTGTIPSVLEMLSGNTDAKALGMPEKGTSFAAGTPNTAKVAWDEDNGLGKFDARDAKYDGGILGAHPGIAMQELADDIVCYQSLTGLHANVAFPPGIFAIGTADKPTLELPTGAYYHSVSPDLTGIGTLFTATYNNRLAMHIEIGVSATCSDSTVHTNTLTAGYYTGFGIHGCGQGGCVNVPGDTGNYPTGGRNQNALIIEDSQGFVDLLASDHNAGDGINIEGQDTHVGRVWGQANMAWYIFGHSVAGQTYDPTTDGWHCNIGLNSLDGTFDGPFETYGYLATPGAEYMHVCAAAWGGGNTQMGALFSNRDQVCLVRANGQNNGRVVGGRCDAPMGEGIVVGGAGNSFISIDNSSACSGFATIPRGAIFGPYIATLGSGQTPGSYDVAAVNHGGDSIGAGAVLTVVIDGTGKASTITVKTAGTGYLATPTFPFSAAGGTPATIGATMYHHCDNLDDDQGSGSNSYVGVKNIYENFFGPDYATGTIWTGETGGNGDTFDRSTTGTLERVVGIVNEPKGNGAHRDLLDMASGDGGVAIHGPALDFSAGNHYHANDSTPTNWSGPFTVASVMQDLWIYGGNANATLPVSAGWQTCSGYDLNLADPRWYHFFVYQDDVFAAVGTNFIFKEQCDSIDQTHWWVNHESNKASLPALEYQRTIDSMGDIGAHAIPPFTSLAIQAGGTPGPNGVGGTFTYTLRVWGTFGTQTSSNPAVNQCLPKAGFINNPCFQTPFYTLPEGWTHYQLFRETSTDATATAGMILEITKTAPQHAQSTAFADSQIAPINSNVIGAGNLNANMTGTLSTQGSTLPPRSAYPGVKDQIIIDPTVSTGAMYYCDADDHWVKAPLPFANF